VTAAGRPLPDLEAGLLHVMYELQMCVESSTRLPRAADGVESNAYLEAQLVHARNLTEFLVQPIKTSKKYESDLRRIDFAPEDWNPLASTPAAARLSAAYPIISKHLSHLTWDRVDSGQQPWAYPTLAQDVIETMAAWGKHLAGQQEDLADVLLVNVKGARRMLVAAFRSDP
jgi:hypothetical protein